MEGVAGAVAGAVLNVVNDRVIPDVEDHVITVAKKKFRSLWFLEEEIDKISKLRDNLQDLREVAETKQLDDKEVREWLLHFKNAMYDVEDVLCDYTRMVVRVEDSQGIIIRWMAQAKDGVFLMCAIPFSCLEDIITQATTRIEIASRLSFINMNLNNISQNRAVSTRESSGGSDAPNGESSMWKFRERTMIGRDETKANLKDALLKHAKTPCSKLLVIGIVGAGGMGKTTLAHYIYNDKDVMAAYDIKMFLKVGQKMDIKWIMNEIIGDGSNLQREDALQSTMEKNLKQKSVLIVLDDAWCVETDVWDLLRVSLSNKEKPHCLIVTARNKGVPRVIQHECKYIESELVAMPDEECGEIFKRWVLKGETYEKFNEWPWFEEAVKKLKGVPLAAEIMGRLLSDHVHDNEKWRYVVSNMSEQGNVVDQVTGLSYRLLPSHLKPCFAYCAMLPIGYRFDKEELVRMWIAQGFIQSDKRKLMEVTGKEYFDDLHQRSFFQSDHDGIDAQSYIMHDLIHEFARKVYTEGDRVDTYDKCWDHNVTIEKFSKEIRHMSLVDERSGSWPIEERKLKCFKKLRTLICYDTIFQVELANQFNYLRLLIIVHCDMEELPDSVRHLKLLQYLDVSETKIKSLPESMCDLVDLKFLYLPGSCRILPEGMTKLLNLRFVKRGRTKRGEYVKIKGIGKLLSLQGCNIYFTVRNECGWQISELRGSNHLRGTLTIVGLECVRSKEEAEQGFLRDKSHLQKLVLRWNISETGQQQDNIVDDIQESSSWSSDSETEVLEEESASSGQQEHVVDSQAEEVLEGLRPPSGLESLAIYDHRGARPPSWLKDQWPFLVELELDGCCHWESLLMPTKLQKLSINKAEKLRMGGGVRTDNVDTGWTLPYLKELKVKSCPKLTTLCQIIYIRGSKNLEIIEIVNSPKLVSLEKQDGHRHGSPLPLLWKFSIKDCPKLTSLSPINLHSSEKLKVIEIVNCPELASLEEHYGYGGGSPFPDLWKLNIKGCSKLGSLSPISLHSSEKLDHIKIVNCPQLATLEEQNAGGLERPFSTVKKLKIKGCPRLTSLSPIISLHNSYKLEMIEIFDCRELASLRVKDGEGCEWPMACLRKLSISDCPKLTSLSPINLHSSEKLKVIEIVNCPELASLEEHYGYGGGRSFPDLLKLSIKGCLKLVSLSPISLHSSEKLDSIKIVNCPQLATLEEQDAGGLERPFSTIKKLKIKGCPRLTSLSAIIGFHNLYKLETIEIFDCRELASLEVKDGEGCGRLMPCLRKLSISDCPKLTSLCPIIFHGAINLRCITIMNCPELMLLEKEEGDRPGILLPFLRELNIEGCPKLNLPSSVRLLEKPATLQICSLSYEIYEEVWEPCSRDDSSRFLSLVGSPVFLDVVEDDLIPTAKDMISVAKEELEYLWNLEDEIDNISKLVETLKDVQEVADKKQFEDPAWGKWLSDFKNVVYDVQDLVCDYRELGFGLENVRGVLTRWTGHAKDSLFLLSRILFSCLKDIPLPVTPRIEIAHRIRTINMNLDRIQKLGDNMNIFSNESGGDGAVTEISGPPLWEYEKQLMTGRVEEKSEIKMTLLKHSQEHIEEPDSKLLVIGIVGPGEVGKTTLARSIFKDEDVMLAYDTKKWLYVGQKFGIQKIMDEIIGWDSRLEDPLVLHSTMREKYRKRSLLVVLDEDVMFGAPTLKNGTC